MEQIVEQKTRRIVFIVERLDSGIYVHGEFHIDGKAVNGTMGVRCSDPRELHKCVKQLMENVPAGWWV